LLYAEHSIETPCAEIEFGECGNALRWQALIGKFESTPY
jgi:hypothetical protein